MNILVGNSGLVGSNLAEQYDYDGLFRRSNIAQAYGLRPNLCVYAGMPAQKFLANRNPSHDRQALEGAIENLRRIAPKRVVLISTIDVFCNPAGADETAEVCTQTLTPYGLHRYELEQWLRQNIDDYCIIRLPALLGKNLKKNFLFDLIHLIPSMLSSEKFAALDDIARPYYTLSENDMYTLKPLSAQEKIQLRNYFEHASFNAMHFTDSRATFPFYDLKHLWHHIELAMREGLHLLHCATQPLAASEVVRAVKGEYFTNELPSRVPYYDFKTIHADIFGGANGYMFNKTQVLNDILSFYESNK